MKIFHISDLHIGKQLHFYNLIKNQEHILDQIVTQVKQYQPDAILIAGDIFDRSVPSGEAYSLFDEFLTSLSLIEPKLQVFVIAGNHDSAERLNYASSFLEKHRIYISVLPPQQEGEYLKKITLSDEYGEVDFYLLPFTKPSYVRWLFPEEAGISYDSAVRKVIERENIDYATRRNVLMAHQFFVSGTSQPETSDSEQRYISVGGIDSVDASAVSRFDYVALGHIHGPQSIGGPNIRYCGTPLKYSVSEEKQKKSITMITFAEKEKGISVQEIPLCPYQDVRREKGTLAEVISRADPKTKDDFISVTLTDEEELFKPKEQLEEHYSHILELRIENTRTRALAEDMGDVSAMLSPAEAFREFYQEMNGERMSDPEISLLSEVIGKLQGQVE